MGLVTKVGQGFRDFRNGLHIIFGKPSAEGGGDRKLAKISLILESQVDSHNKHQMCAGVIKDIERVLGKEAKRGGKDAVERKVAISLATPEWVQMLHRVGLGESDIRILAMEAVEKYAK
jgi:hypothetical protein